MPFSDDVLNLNPELRKLGVFTSLSAEPENILAPVGQAQVVVTIALPWPNPVLNPNATKTTKRNGQKRHIHWTDITEARRTAKETAYFATLQAKPANWLTPSGRLPITITFHPPHRIKFDLDNKLAACKPYQDGVALALGMDDSRFRPVILDEGAPVKSGLVVVQIGANPYAHP